MPLHEAARCALFDDSCTVYETSPAAARAGCAAFHNPRSVMADVADLHLDLTQPGFYLRPDYFDVLADLRRHAPVY
jgi:hypothetical protein